MKPRVSVPDLKCRLTAGRDPPATSDVPTLLHLTYFIFNWEDS